MMHCNTGQFSGAMEVETHGLGDDTGLDCFTAMSPDLADIELSRMVAVTTGQSLTSDMSSRCAIIYNLQNYSINGYRFGQRHLDLTLLPVN